MGQRIKILLVRRLYLFLTVLVGLTSIATVIFAWSSDDNDTTKVPHYDAYFLWAGVKPQAILETAKTVYILYGEVREEDSRRIVNLRAGVPHVVHADIWMTVRVERIDWQYQIFDQLLNEIQEWEDAGNRLKGVQIDFDAATLHLDKYVAFLTKLRQLLPERFGLSITGVMDWIVLSKASSLAGLSEVIDEVVIQTYQGRNTIEGYEAYLRDVNRLNFPYRIGVVQHGDWQEPTHLSNDQNFKGYVVFLVNPENRALNVKQEAGN
jgi:hypothetical protein